MTLSHLSSRRRAFEPTLKLDVGFDESKKLICTPRNLSTRGLFQHRDNYSSINDVGGVEWHPPFIDDEGGPGRTAQC